MVFIRFCVSAVWEHGRIVSCHGIPMQYMNNPAIFPNAETQTPANIITMIGSDQMQKKNNNKHYKRSLVSSICTRPPREATEQQSEDEEMGKRGVGWCAYMEAISLRTAAEASLRNETRTGTAYEKRTKNRIT